MFKRPFIIFYLVLVSLMIFQILLLLNKAVKGIHKYFFLNEKDLLDEFNEETETVFEFDDSCRMHYKEMNLIKK
jgi:predicted Holliday junction resolvase-like endonuclease